MKPMSGQSMNKKKKDPRAYTLPFAIPTSKAERKRRLTEHVTVSEIADSESNTVPMIGLSPVVLSAFEFIRAEIGYKPILILSGFRTPETNEACGGAKNSFHLLGRALDLSLSPARKRRAIVASEIFFKDRGGIGVYKWGIHIDDREDKARWVG